MNRFDYNRVKKRSCFILIDVSTCTYAIASNRSLLYFNLLKISRTSLQVFVMMNISCKFENSAYNAYCPRRGNKKSIQCIPGISPADTMTIISIFFFTNGTSAHPQ